jgi:hypothetical protein
MDDQEKLWNLALVSVFFWAQERAREPAPLADIMPMNEALAVLAVQSGTAAKPALRLAYTEAVRVYPRLSDQAKEALKNLGQRLGLPPLTDTDAAMGEEARVAAALTALGGRAVTRYRMRVKP